MPTTMREIAEAAGVSRPVVSAVLSGGSGTVRVSEQKAAQIRRIAEELGYQKQWRSSVMTGGRTRLIGLLGAHRRMEVHHDGDLLRGLTDGLRRHGLSLVHAPAEPEAERESLLDGRFDGCLIDFVVMPEQVELLAQAKLPGIIINADPRDGVPACRLDEVDAARKTFEHLDVLGHERLLYVDIHPIGKPFRAGMGEQASRRRSAWDAVVEEAKSTIVSHEAVELPTTYFNDLEDALERSGIEQVMRRPPAKRPTAIVAYDAVVATCVAQALDGWGISCPKDVSLIALQDSSYLQVRRPPITAVHQDFYRLGKVCADRLHALIGLPPGDARDSARQDVLVESPLIVRNSTGVPPQV